MAKSSKRIRAEKGFYEMMDVLDPSGYNTSRYKEVFDGMSDSEFDSYMKDIEHGTDVPSFDIDSMTAKDELTTEHLFKKGRKLGIKTHQHVIYLENKGVGGEPMVTPEPVPILVLPVKRLQQMIDKKNAAAGDIDKVDILMGQVVRDSKASRISDVQTMGMLTSGHMSSIKELMGPRADDPVSKQQMMEKIEDYGEVSLDDLSIETKNKQALATSRVLLRSAGLDISVS